MNDNKIDKQQELIFFDAIIRTKLISSSNFDCIALFENNGVGESVSNTKIEQVTDYINQKIPNNQVTNEWVTKKLQSLYRIMITSDQTAETTSNQATRRNSKRISRSS